MRLGWEVRLREWAVRRLGNPFVWGETDCAILCFEAVDCLTGSKLACVYRGQYLTRRQALKFQRRRAVNLETALSGSGIFQHQGLPLVGDILLHQHPEWPFVVGHVCFGEFCLSANESHGVVWGRSADVLAMPGGGAWRAI